MSNYQKNKKNTNFVRGVIEKCRLNKGFSPVDNSKIHNKRPILLTLLIFVIILQFWYINVQDKRLVEKDHYYIELMEQVKVELDRQHEEVVNEHLVTIQQLSEENVDLNELNKNLELENKKLGETISSIAKQLNVTKQTLISDPKLPSRGGGGYLKKLTMNVTAYTAGYESTGKTPSHPAYGITTSGTTVKEGRTVACPPNYPFGTKLFIPEMNNTYICEDRGSAIKNDKLDIYMKKVKDARTFGRRNLEVHIIKWGE